MLTDPIDRCTETLFRILCVGVGEGDEVTTLTNGILWWTDCGYVEDLYKYSCTVFIIEGRLLCMSVVGLLNLLGWTSYQNFTTTKTQC